MVPGRARGRARRGGTSLGPGRHTLSQADDEHGRCHAAHWYVRDAVSGGAPFGRLNTDGTLYDFCAGGSLSG